MSRKKLIRFELTKVRRNVKKQIKHVGCKCTTVGRNAANVPRYRD